MQPPEIRIVRGSPTTAEVEAVHAAIIALWREDQARAARDTRANAWTLAARVQGANAAAEMAQLRARRTAWR